MYALDNADPYVIIIFIAFYVISHTKLISSSTDNFWKKKVASKRILF